MKLEEKQYYAGLIDSEGYFQMRVYRGTQRQNNLYFKLEITEEEILRPLSELFNVEISSQDRGPGRKTIYNIRLGLKTNLIEFIEMFLPFLNEKRGQAQLLLDYYLLDEKTESNNIYYFDLYTEEKLNPKTEDINFSPAYLAGVMDGDGYFGVKKQGSFTALPFIGLEQCYTGLIEFLYKTYGGSLSTRKIKKKNHRPRDIWSVQDLETCNYILEIFAPFIKIKESRVKIMKKLYKLKKPYIEFVTDLNRHDG